MRNKLAYLLKKAGMLDEMGGAGERAVSNLFSEDRMPLPGDMGPNVEWQPSPLSGGISYLPWALKPRNMPFAASAPMMGVGGTLADYWGSRLGFRGMEQQARRQGFNAGRNNPFIDFN